MIQDIFVFVKGDIKFNGYKNKEVASMFILITSILAFIKRPAS